MTTGGETAAMASGKPCVNHPDVAQRLACALCVDPLCDECAAFTVDQRVSCARCASIAGREGRPRWDLAGAFALSGAGATWAAYVVGKSLGLAGVMGAVMLVIAAVLAYPRGTKKRVLARVAQLAGAGAGAGAEIVIENPGGPYRGGRTKARLPGARMVSGRATALLLLGTFAATALALPFSMNLPRWVEWEIVFGVWALALAATLTTLLYRGWHVAHDHRMVVLSDRFSRSHRSESYGATRSSRWSWWNLADGGGSADIEGCFGAVVIAMAALVSFVAAWLVVELVAPALFFVAYWLVMKAVARVANDRHACAGDFGKSLIWGGTFTLFYLGPLAFAVALLHALVRARHGVP